MVANQTVMSIHHNSKAVTKLYRCVKLNPKLSTSFKSLVLFTSQTILVTVFTSSLLLLSRLTYELFVAERQRLNLSKESRGDKRENIVILS